MELKTCKLCDMKNFKKQLFFETKFCYVIYNKYAATKGQCLIVPKRHIENIRELNDLETIDLMNLVKIISDKIQKIFSPKGFNYGFNEKSNQHINHFHFHIIPRYESDNLPNLILPKPENFKKLEETELKNIICELKKEFENCQIY